MVKELLPSVIVELNRTEEIQSYTTVGSYMVHERRRVMFNISGLLHRLSGENPEKSGRIDAFTFGSGVIISLSLAMSVFSSEPGTLFPVDLGGPIYSSAIVADIDQDGMDEILVGSDSDKLFCLDANGLTKWQYQTGDDVRSSPALGDIDQDGYLDVVFQSEDGYLYVLDKDGQTLPGWPRPLGSIPYNSYYTATPVLADIDGDSELEIITLSPYRETFNTIRVYAFNSDGETEWTWEKDWPGTESISAHAVTSPAVADVNGDGILEVVVYFNITYHYPSGPGVGIYAIRGTDHQLVYEREWSIPITYSSPSIADINKDGKLEVILSCYYPGAFTSVQAITIEDDFVLWGWYDNPRIDNLSRSSPVIGNINSEFYPEIVPGGNLITLEHDGDIIWWNNDVYSINSSTVLGDIDNDEQMEIFTAASYSGEIHGFDGDGTELDGFPLETDPDYSIQATPVLCDRDRDGYMDIIVGSTDGRLYRLGDHLHV